MLRSSWLRSSAVAVGAGALVLGAAHCGSLNEASGGVPYFDGGSDVSSDAPGDGGAAGPTVLAVNASPDLGDVRFCFAVGGSFYNDLPVPGDAPMPASNYPGVARGGGSLLPDMGLMWATDVDLYVLHADKIASDTKAQPGPTCADLVCDPSVSSTCLYPGEYFQLASAIPAGTLTAGGTYLLAIIGCTPAADDTTGTTSAAKCGSDYAPTFGNLSAVVTRLDALASGSPTLAAFAQLAPAIDGVLLADAGAGASVQATYGPLDAASGTDLHAGAYPTMGSPASIQLPTDLAGFASTGVVAQVTAPSADGGPLLELTMSLADIARLSAPAEPPNNYYGTAAGFVFALVGDPTYTPEAGAAGGYDGRTLHVLALPVP
jgi:hypothetical protein